MITKNPTSGLAPMACAVFLRWLFIVISMVALVGCASHPSVVRHGFAFDFIDDSPDAELLDYRYGDSRNPAARNSMEERNRGKSRQQSDTAGEMLRGDELYVKWRLKATGEKYEDTVDLRSRLPADIEGCRVYFLVRGPQLYVYLITPQKRDKNEPRNGPSKWSSYRTVTLYPGQPKF